MNKLLFLILILYSLKGQAQVTDTLGYSNFLSGTTTLYESPNGGFAFGNNGYNDKAKAQTYFYEDDSFVLREILLLFGKVIFGSGDSLSAVKVNIYQNHGVGVTSIGTSDSIAPSNILASVNVPVHRLVDDGGFSTADFVADTLVINGRFSVGIELTMLSTGDTVGLFSTTDGDGQGNFSTWEQTSNDTWFTVEESVFSWDLDIDLAIFPVIDANDPAGIPENNRLQWNLYPNPSSESVWLNLPQNDDWEMTVRTILGKTLYVERFFGRTNTLDVSQFGSGILLLTISNKEQTGTQRLIVN